MQTDEIRCDRAIRCWQHRGSDVSKAGSMIGSRVMQDMISPTGNVAEIALVDARLRRAPAVEEARNGV